MPSATAIGRRKRAAVVVLGDIGRSPRMQYHTLSLANQACSSYFCCLIWRADERSAYLTACSANSCLLAIEDL
jgi:hypothetical protein